MASPDPTAQYGSPAFYAALGRAFVVMCLVFPVLALIEFIDQRLDGRLEQQFGLRTHEVSGLDGVLFAPLLHNGWSHLVGNSSALIILGTFALAAGTRRFLLATLFIALASGLGAWFLSPPHVLVVGSSGVIFGWLGLVLMRGLVERSRWHLAVVFIAGLLYGAQLNLIMPTDEPISWEGHLCGFVAGLLAAVLTRTPSPKPAPRPS